MARGVTQVGVLVLFLAGCAGPEPVRTSAPRPGLRGKALQGELIQMDVALLERPVGDPFLNKQLWDFTDEQAVELEHRAALDDNGIRVGQLVGMSPERLQSLLTSERSCINPRRLLLPSGRSAPVKLGPILAQVSFQVKQSRTSGEITLDQAQFLLDVTPTLTADGRTCLHFTPKVEYGEALPDLRAATDHADWTLQLTKPCRTLDDLSWELTLAPNDLLVVGPCSSQANSFGYQAFVQDEGPKPVQRLLVLRTNRSTGSGEGDTLEDLARGKSSPALALQATMTSARAQGQ
jgi:hypothetical protein